MSDFNKKKREEEKERLMHEVMKKKRDYNYGSIDQKIELRNEAEKNSKEIEKIEKEVATQAPHLLPAVRSRHMSACFNMLRLMPLNDPQWLPTRNRCWEYVKNMRFLCIKDPKVCLKNKIAILLSFFGLNFLLAIINRR